MTQALVHDKNILVFAPHPDDAELAMGGTLALLIEQGWHVTVADVTTGEPTPAGSEAIRKNETAAASKALGITERINLGLPNRYVEVTLENRHILAETIRQYKPRWVFAPYTPDAHPDHVHISQLIQDACFAAKLTKTETKYEPHHPEKVIYYYATHLKVHPVPSFCIDISAQWDKKVAAMTAYQSQFWSNQKAPEKQGWIIDHLSTINHYFGNRTGVKYAEPFFTHELVALASLEGLL